MNTPMQKISQRWKSYPTYKDSGIEWCREVPGHWQVKRIKQLGGMGNRTFVDGDWIESPYITHEGIRLIQTGNIGIGRYKEQGFRYVSEQTFKELDCTEVFPNDILICRLAEPVGRACLAPNLNTRMITSVDICILKPSSDYNPSFVVYFLSSIGYLGWLLALSRGSTRDRISRYMLGNIAFISPPIEEQRQIAAFLDRETARIDALIERKERLIELLQERRAALISHAVTKGLDPDVPMKDSGVEWMGEIPVHWELQALKYQSTFVTSGSRGWAEYYSDEGPIFIRVGNLSGTDSLDLDLTDIQRVSPPKDAEGERTRVRGGDVLLAITGATIGATSVISGGIGEAYVNQHVALIRPAKLAYSKWIGYVLSSDLGQTQVDLMLTGGTKDGLGLDDVRNFEITVPELEEQDYIIQLLDTDAKRKDLLVSRIQRAIDHLREYRTALISAAVTGKIDVRDGE